MISSSEKKEREFLNACGKLIETYKHNTMMARKDDINDLASEFYRNLKWLAHYYYKGEKLPNNYWHFAQQVEIFERLLPSMCIFEYAPHDFSKVLDMPSSLENTEAVLDYLVDQTRNFLFDKVTFDRSFFPFETYDLLDKCVKATEFAHYTAKKMGLDSWEIIIYPNFRRSYGLNNSGVHLFLLVLLDGKSYLVDCTYSQFCRNIRCNLDRIGASLLVGAAPGAFMLMNKTRQEVALQLLTRGWIECREEVIKAYFDGFMLARRNGIYYQRTGDCSFEVPYTAECYEDFIYGFDSLLHYEEDEELGVQLKPLDNPDMLIRYKEKM